MTARVSMLLKSRKSPDMLPFSLCNKKRLAIRHMNKLLFPTTLSIPSYDIGKYVGLRTYQHPLVIERHRQQRDCAGSDGKTINEVLIEKDVEGSGSGLILGSLLPRNLSWVKWKNIPVAALRRWFAATRLRGLWVLIPPGAWMSVCCECFVLSGRGLCVGLMTCPEESYRV